MKAVASAPGKIILFGEHAVVFGKPALAMAVNRRARVEVRTVEEDHLFITIPALDVTGTQKHGGKLETSGTGKRGILEYIIQAIQLMKQKRQV